MSFTLLSFLLGCSKGLQPIEESTQHNGSISVSSRSSSGAITTLADGIRLGLSTDSYKEDLDEFVDVNIPYTLTNGALIAEQADVALPEGYGAAYLYAYGPYTTDGINLGPNPNRPPFYTFTLAFGVQLDQRTQGTASSDLVWGILDRYTGAENKHNITLVHKLCRVKIKLSSELGNDISEAKVTLISVVSGGSMRMKDGELTIRTSDDFRDHITAFQNPDGTYEAIIPPQTILAATDYVRVELDGKTYNFRLRGEKKLLEGVDYTFDLTVKDKGDLPFTIMVTYDTNKKLGDQLSVGARETTYDITMDEIPNSGSGVSFTYLRIRNASGERSWARINNTHSSNKDDLYHQVRYAQIIFEENLSPDPREMILEFYNTTDSKFVHKRVKINQAGATQYFTLSSPSLSVDRWGNMYDTPLDLVVRSSTGWTLENNAPDWVTISGYSAGNRNNTIGVTCKENLTGSPRTAELNFLVDGVSVKRFSITQSTVENPTFTLKYELNLHYTTINDWFRRYVAALGEYYAAHITIFAMFEPNADTAAEINTEDPYGFVTDAPASANTMVVNDFASKYFICPSYNGSARTISGINSSISGSSGKTKQNFFRQLIFNLPFPANVKRNEKVKFTVRINNVKDTGSHDPAIVTSEIVKQ